MAGGKKTPEKRCKFFGMERGRDFSDMNSNGPRVNYDQLRENWGPGKSYLGTPKNFIVDCSKGLRHVERNGGDSGGK